MTISVLFIGGTGVISNEAVRLSVRRGHDVTVLNRGTTSLRGTPASSSSSRRHPRTRSHRCGFR